MNTKQWIGYLCQAAIVWLILHVLRLLITGKLFAHG
jgi:hypothetical protein